MGMESTWGATTQISPTARKLRILLVDDEHLMRHGLLRCLRTHQVFQAESYAAAIEILKIQPLDVVISDCSMPGPNGIEVLLEASRIQPEAHRFMFSAHPPLELSELIYKGLIHQFFLKPYFHPMLQILSAMSTASKR